MAFHIRFYLLLLVVLILAACGGLAGEPRIIATFPPPTAIPDNISVVPDIANGARIYAANCVRCHGIGGAGDGEFAQSGEVQNVPDFTDAAHTQMVTPLDWYDTITNGNLQALMPPWRDTLSEQARWDVALYVYTLSYSADMLLQGQQLAQSYDPTTLSTLIATRGLFRFSDADSITQLSASIPTVDSLSVDQKRALAAYLRSLSVTGSTSIGQSVQVPTPLATEEVAAPTDVPIITNAGAPNTISGRVTNGTVLGTVPPDTIVTLHIINPDFTTETTMNAPIAADGSFVFNGVQFLDGANFFVSAPYQNRLFASQTVQSDTTMTSLELPIIVYDLTQDTAVIGIIGMVTQISESATGDGLEFLQVIRFRNHSDRMFTTTMGVGDSSFASVVLQLPPGSVVLGLQGGEDRYVVLQEQSTVVDTLPVLPNKDHLMQLLYFVPYTNGAIIDQQLNYSLDGPVRILINEGSAISVQSNQLAPLGPETIGEREFESFGGDLTLQPGGVVSYTLNGQIGPQTASGVISSNNLLAMLMIIAGSVLLLFIIVMALRQRYAPKRAPQLAPQAAPKPVPQAVPADKNKLIDALVRQIAELDEQHDKGEINHDLYHQRRTKLKARLAELMDEK